MNRAGYDRLAAAPGGAGYSLADIRQEHQARLGMWVFLATELMFLGPVFVGYVVLRQQFPQAMAEASHLTDVALGTINTLVLLTSSLAMALAVETARLGARTFARRALWLTAALGLVFLAIKGYEYGMDWREHLFPDARFHAKDVRDQAGARMFFFFYFFSTGLHALHLLVGMALTLAMARTLAASPAARAARRLELTGLYWHFVDIVWIFLYPMLYLLERWS